MATPVDPDELPPMVEATDEASAAAFRSLVATYSPAAAQGAVLREHIAALCGVVAEQPRSHSPKLGFLLLRSAEGGGDGEGEPPEVQVVMNLKFAAAGDEGHYAEAWRSLGVGDVVRVVGHPGKTRTGTRAEGFSLFACSFAVQRMAPDVDRALRLLLQLPNAAAAAAAGTEAGELPGTAAADASAAAEPTEAEHELRRLLCSMLHEEQPTAPVLQLLASLAAPRLECRRREDRLAVEGAALAAAATAELADDAEAVELPSAAAEARSDEELSAARMQRVRAVASRRQRGLVVVLEGLDQPANIGAALRTCDGFGVATVCHIRPSQSQAASPTAEEAARGVRSRRPAESASAAAAPWFDSADPVVQACSKSASVWLRHLCFESIAECVAWLKQEDIPSVATTPPHDELKEWSGQLAAGVLEPEPEEPLPPHRVRDLYDASCAVGGADELLLPWGGARLAVWFGNESKGLSQAALRLVRESGEAGCMTVPMLGMVESLNIAATVAVCLTEVTRQRCVRRAEALRQPGAEGAGAYDYAGAELEALVKEMAAVARR